MAYAFNILPVVAAVRAVVNAGLSRQGQIPYALPLTTTARQVSEYPGTLPMTLLQIKACKTDTDCPINSIRIHLPIIVHHIRETEPGTGSGVETALALMTGLAAAITTDYHLTAGQGGANPLSIEQANVESIDCGDDNIVQMLLDQAAQTDQVAVSLSLTVTWVEDLITRSA